MAVKRVFQSRIARLSLALTIIAVSGWAFAPYVLYRVAPVAFVNAPLIRVTSPIPGRLTDEMPSKGDFPDRRVAVTLVEARSPTIAPFLISSDNALWPREIANSQFVS